MIKKVEPQRSTAPIGYNSAVLPRLPAVKSPQDDRVKTGLFDKFSSYHLKISWPENTRIDPSATESMVTRRLLNDQNSSPAHSDADKPLDNARTQATGPDLAHDVAELVKAAGYAAVSRELAKHAPAGGQPSGMASSVHRRALTSGVAMDGRTPDVVEASLRLTTRQVESLLEDSTLGRLQRRYDTLLQIELPLERLDNLEQARTAAQLSTTYDNLQERRIHLGLDPLPKEPKVLEARRMSSAFYRGERKQPSSPTTTPSITGRTRRQTKLPTASK